MTARQVQQALSFEIACYYMDSRPIPPEIVSLIRADIRDAAKQNDAARLECLWHELPRIIADAITYKQSGGLIPV